MAAPVVSGTVALMLQANPKLTPNLVKAILQYTAQEYPGYNAASTGRRLPELVRRGPAGEVLRGEPGRFTHARAGHVEQERSSGATIESPVVT